MDLESEIIFLQSMFGEDELKLLESSQLNPKWFGNTTSNNKKEWQKILQVNVSPSTAGNLDAKFIKCDLLLLISEKYPQEIPTFVLKETKGMEDNQIKSLKVELESLARKNIGQDMLFILIDACKDYLTKHNQPATECVICLTSFEDESPELFMKTHCFHYLHRACLADWCWSLEEKFEKKRLESLSTSTQQPQSQSQSQQQQSSNSEDQLHCPSCRSALNEVDMSLILTLLDAHRAKKLNAELEKEEEIRRNKELIIQRKQEQLEKEKAKQLEEEAKLEAERNKPPPPEYVVEIAPIPTNFFKPGVSGIKKHFDIWNPLREEPLMTGENRTGSLLFFSNENDASDVIQKASWLDLGGTKQFPRLLGIHQPPPPAKVNNNGGGSKVPTLTVLNLKPVQPKSNSSFNRILRTTDIDSSFPSVSGCFCIFLHGLPKDVTAKTMKQLLSSLESYVNYRLLITTPEEKDRTAMVIFSKKKAALQAAEQLNKARVDTGVMTTRLPNPNEEQLLQSLH